MDVAIIGAGLAGLACAHELERYGISPVIYERRSFIGEEYNHVGAVLEVVHRPIDDAIKYFKNEFELELKPLETVKSIVHFSPNKATVIKGDNLGYFLERSQSSNDMKVQMSSTLKKTRIIFNQDADYELLSKQYDYVVVANGHVDATIELGCWQEWVSTFVRAATVYGEFDPTSMTVWLNQDYCKNGYAYLTPFDSKRASIALVVTDVNEIEIERYWELFLTTERIDYPIQENFKLKHLSGHVYPHKVNKVLLAGNAGGAIDPFLGFGIIKSIFSGAMAARSIAEGMDYEKLLDAMVKQNLRLFEFRKALNLSNNTIYDLMFSSIAIPGLKHLMYYTPLNVIKIGSSFLKLLPKK
ncbi:MAG: dehydrogenase [Clostridiales bacterium]|jgi:flavin-dependent dehydrogenase|nr:dehydrogenase [Clostridiales bacterium]